MHSGLTPWELAKSSRICHLAYIIKHRREQGMEDQMWKGESDSQN